MSGICNRNPVCIEIDHTEDVSHEATFHHVMTHVGINSVNSQGDVIREAHGVLYNAGDTRHDQSARNAFSRHISERDTNFSFADHEAVEVVSTNRLSRIVRRVKPISWYFRQLFRQQRSLNAAGDFHLFILLLLVDIRLHQPSVFIGVSGLIGDSQQQFQIFIRKSLHRILGIEVDDAKRLTLDA